MIFAKIKNMFIEKRLPWFLKVKIIWSRNCYCYVKNRLGSFFDRSHKRAGTLKITFNCGFHGSTGGVFAIASIANLLARKHQVEFLTYPGSNFNALLSSAVCLKQSPDMESDLFICDVSCPLSFLDELKVQRKKLIISCHGFLKESHGLDPVHVKNILSYATKVHFVSSVQQESFCLKEGFFQVIPNTTKRIKKITQTNNVGSVGNLDDVRKNAEASVDIAINSNAGCIHLWSVEKDIWHSSKVVTHKWEGNKNKIYDSFDVLVFMSQLETFGLVVIEAMSAGIPCVLSSIPAFEQFRDCPGVVIIDSDNLADAPELLNDLLNHKDELRGEIIKYFDDNYSEEGVAMKWEKFIVDVISR